MRKTVNHFEVNPCKEEDSSHHNYKVNKHLFLTHKTLRVTGGFPLSDALYEV